MEEDIKRLQKIIDYCKNNKECQENEQCFDCYIEIEDVEAIKNLINRNKELEEENIKLHTEIAEVVYWESSSVEQIKQDYIPKSKVREKIEFIKSLNEKIYYEENVISILEDLQKGDK